MVDTINGYPVVATWRTEVRDNGRAGGFILVDRGAERDERYVVAWLVDWEMQRS